MCKQFCMYIQTDFFEMMLFLQIISLHLLRKCILIRVKHFYANSDEIFARITQTIKNLNLLRKFIFFRLPFILVHLRLKIPLYYEETMFEQKGFFLPRLWLFFSPFLFPPFKRRKKKRRMNNQSLGQKQCLSARSKTIADIFISKNKKLVILITLSIKTRTIYFHKNVSQCFIVTIKNHETFRRNNLPFITSMNSEIILSFDKTLRFYISVIIHMIFFLARSVHKLMCQKKFS